MTTAKNELFNLWWEGEIKIWWGESTGGGGMGGPTG